MKSQVYNIVPALQEPRPDCSCSELPLPSHGSHSSTWHINSILTSWIRPLKQSLSLYFRHPVFLPSFALALLYFTVLSFASQMVAYLLSIGYTSTHVGIIRTVSVMFEISATWLAPWAMNRIGPVRAGLWFINWQILCIASAVASFWAIRDLPLLSGAGLVAGVITSRIGLWGFDLCVQLIVQEVCSYPPIHQPSVN
jgi:iron-regulated transporter 1